MAIRSRTLNLFTLAAIASCLMAGAMTRVIAQTTTLGTRSSLSQANPPIASNAEASWSHYDRAAEYPSVRSLPVQYITTSTGEKLSVRVSVPANSKGEPASGKFPVILTQTAYRNDVGHILGSIVRGDTTLMIGGQDDYMIRRGYINVNVDALGTGMSTGEAQLIGELEQQAYAETVQWVQQQPWFKGRMGLAGTSYLAITSLLTAVQQHPSVKAVFASVPMGDAYRSVVGPGGLMNAQFLSIWLPLTHGLSVGALNAVEQLLQPQLASTIKLANQQHLNAIESWYLPTVKDGLAGKAGMATDDGMFWSVRSPLESAHQLKVPTFLVGGANDIFQRDVPLLYEQVKRKVDAKLLVLPGTHIGSLLKLLAGSEGVPKGRFLLLQWFDHYLKGMDTGADTMPNVTQYVQGYGTDAEPRFARATDWPHPKMTAQRMYFRNGNSLSTQAPSSVEATAYVLEPRGAEVLVENRDDSLKVDLTIYDGSKCSGSYRQWTMGLKGLLPWSCYVSNNQVDTAQKAAIYETPTLTADLYLNGPIQADVWITTTHTDAALAVRVASVSPNGVATPISTGLMSARYRAVDKGRSRFVNGVMLQPWHPFTVASTQAVVPGQPMLVPVEIFPNAALIRAGHKLRVVISASNQVQGVWPLPNQANANGNTTVILNSAEHPSSIVLPVVPSSSLN